MRKIKTFNIDKFQGLSLVFLVLMFLFLFMSYGVLDKTRMDYIKSNEILNLNTDLDKLFKDVVYLPLVVNANDSEILISNKKKEVNLKIQKLIQLVKDQLPEADIVTRINQGFNQLLMSDNNDKLNILLDLEMLNKTLSFQESYKMNFGLDSMNRSLRFLILFEVFFCFIIIVLTFTFKKVYQNDLSELKLQLSKTIESSKSMSTYLAIAGHELRTPLNGIIGISEILRKSHLPQEETHYADNLYHSGKALLKIINNILEFTKLQSGKVVLENEYFLVGSIIQQIVTTFSVRAKEKNIKFSFVIDPEVPQTLYGDSSRLAQVLYVLVGNAVNFTMNGAIVIKVKVLSKNADSQLRLFFAVEDSGIGLSEDRLGKLFLSMSKITISEKIDENDPGLSFAICNQLVKAMGGDFEVKSKPGLGSSFSFTVIFSKFSEQKLGNNFLDEYQYFDRKKQILPIFANDEKPTILVVDDNPANLLMAQVMLERLGAKTIIANNGKEAINEFPNKKIDLLLIDCRMPVMNGYEAISYLRKNNIKIPILAMTASSSIEEQSKCSKAGCDGFITKPLDLDVLSKELRRILYLEASSISEDLLQKLELSIGHQGMTRVVQAFLDDLPKTEQSLDQFLINNDLESIHRIGHRCKSASLTVGAKGLAKIFKSLENEKNIDNAYRLKEEISLASNKLKTKFSEHLSQLH